MSTGEKKIFSVKITDELSAGGLTAGKWFAILKMQLVDFHKNLPGQVNNRHRVNHVLPDAGVMIRESGENPEQ